MFFDYTLFLHFGGILFQMTHVVDDSVSIQFQVSFQLLFNFNYNFIQFCMSCFILLYKFIGCVYINSLYTHNYLLCCIFLHFMQLLCLLYSDVLWVFYLHVFMPLYYIYYWLFQNPIGLFFTLVGMCWLSVNKDKDKK